MNFNKITELIKKKNIQLKEFIPKNTSLGVDGFRYSISHRTLKVTDLEKISKGLNVPISYWWDDDAEYDFEDPQRYYGRSANEIINELRDDKERLKQRVDELESRLGLKKDGTSGL